MKHSDVAKDEGALLLTQDTEALSATRVEELLTKCGFTGLAKGHNVHHRHGQLAPLPLSTHRKTFQQELRNCPFEAPRDGGASRCSNLHVQWYLWNYVSKCIGLVLKHNDRRHVTADCVRCCELLEAAAAAAGADAHSLESGADMRRFIESLVRNSLGTAVDAAVLDLDIAMLLGDHVQPRTVLAYGLIFSGRLAPVVGRVLARRVTTWVQRFVGLPCPERALDTDELMLEHINLVRQHECRKRGLTNQIEVDSEDEIAHKVAKRHVSDLADRKLVAAVLHTIKSNMAMRHTQANLRSAEQIVQMLHPDEDEFGDLFGNLPSRYAIARTCPLVGDALDHCFAELIEKERGKSFHGCGFITDGSSPQGEKWSGLTFQITVVVACFIPPVEKWELPEYDDKPPCTRKRHLCDILHIPNKFGSTLFTQILPKQMSRIGCSIVDFVSGTTDGGGENEGWAGVHNSMEKDVPSYVRKRGMEHIAWNVCGQALGSIPELKKKYRAAMAYLHEGGTWKRLQDIAVTPVDEGGANLMDEFSEMYARTFRPAPPRSVETRLEQTDHEFLTWLSTGDREAVLIQCMRVDVEQRGIKGSREALAFFSDPFDRARRVIVMELLRRSLYLHRFANEHEHIASSTTPEDMMERAIHVIMTNQPSDEFLDHFRLTWDEIVAQDCLTMSWPRIYLKFVLKDESWVDELLYFHFQLSTKMTAHLRGVLENIARTQWLMMALLSTDASKVQIAGRRMRDHLTRLRPGAGNRFEMYFLSQERLMNELGLLADRPTPCLLWRGRGAFRHLFPFVAARCLANGDAVVPVEGIHGIWQKLEKTKPHMKLVLLNSWLKIRYALGQDAAMPDVDALLPHVKLQRLAHRREYQLVVEQGTVPKKMRQDAIYLERFNLKARHAYLLHGGIGRDRPMARTNDINWEVYCRKLLRPMTFYSFSKLTPHLYVFVASWKAVAGRDTPGEDDEHGRPLACAWFRRLDDDDDDCVRVRRVDDAIPDIVLQHYTLAELIRAAGLYLPVAADASVRTVELNLESKFLDYELTVYDSTREVMADHGGEGSDAYEFVLTNPCDVETVFFESMPLAQMTNVALARRPAPAFF